MEVNMFFLFLNIFLRLIIFPASFDSRNNDTTKQPDPAQSITEH
jgi:hypothetical protein